MLVCLVQLVLPLTNCLSQQLVLPLTNCLSQHLVLPLTNCLSQQLVLPLTNCLSQQLVDTKEEWHLLPTGATVAAEPGGEGAIPVSARSGLPEKHTHKYEQLVTNNAQCYVDKYKENPVCTGFWWQLRIQLWTVSGPGMESISVMLCGRLGASACQMLSHTHTHTHQTSTTFSQQSKHYKHLKSVTLSNISYIKQYQCNLLLTSPLPHNIHSILHSLVPWHNWPRTELTLTHAQLEGEVIEHDHPK